jgi:hypothetical protein
VEVTDRRAAIAVDRLDGQQDIVKSFDAVRCGLGVTGAAILSDGMALIDVGGLLQEWSCRNCSRSSRHLDALREVANIGAGHAATALSQLTSQTIMITVPTINITPLEDVPPHIGDPDEAVAAVLMNMVGDLSGRTLLVFPRATGIRMAEILLRRPHGGAKVERTRDRRSGGREHPQRRLHER